MSQGSGGLADLIPADLRDVTREHMAQAFLMGARKAEKLGQIGPMVTALKSAADVMGFFDAPQLPPPISPEESKRLICEAAATHGMVWPKGAGPA